MEPRRLLALAALLGCARAAPSLAIDGEISFDLLFGDGKTDRDKSKRHSKHSRTAASVAVEPAPAVAGVQLSSTMSAARLARARAHTHARGEEEAVTAAARDECIYRYPERAQLDAMLSNMMNQLTKMFTRVRTALEAETAHRELKRFRVVANPKATFFDAIYINMTREYMKVVNTTRTKKRSRYKHDPCNHQEELRSIWQNLLNHSRESLDRAVKSCVEQYLLVQGDAGGGAAGNASAVGGERDAKGRVSETGDGARARGDARGGHAAARATANDILRRELAHIKHKQLEHLCDNFQLCFHELDE